MDLCLLILALSRRPLLASQIASLTARPPNAVRMTLATLERDGLVSRTVVDTRGPRGTSTWALTATGVEAVLPLATWAREQVRP
jgi:DNA-binding HxlR family transcriptional regulator